ncbi:hypothetical protein GCM10014719_21310 [Planomonospora parontospora subsp. antibiotica]|nr:hypothetical protein GCM10014719_21310 [Planomonospora parontospora subsp. antibiotica]GII15493.1 hypothetical protein Ppa05_22190 [Planomonospora parontospora subsp. antibiotica]
MSATASVEILFSDHALRGSRGSGSGDFFPPAPSSEALPDGNTRSTSAVVTVMHSQSRVKKRDGLLGSKRYGPPAAVRETLASHHLGMTPLWCDVATDGSLSYSHL